MKEVVKILIVIAVMALMIGVATIILKGKGGETLAVLRDYMRFGGRA